MYLSRISTAPVLLVSVIILLVFIFVIVPDMTRIMDELSSGLGSPDRLFYYDAQKLTAFAKEYANEGRHAYIRTRITHDIAWPFAYAGFFCLVIGYANNISIPRNNRLHRLNLLPLIPVGFDLLENAIVSIIMLDFPDPRPFLTHLAGIVTAVKWSSVAASVLTCLCAIGYAIRYRIKKHH